jgi:glutaredoxin
VGCAALPVGPGAAYAGPVTADARITLVSKPGCHLCDEARAVIERVAAELGVDWQERSIADDPALAEQYWEQIPVTFVDGRQHDYWRVDEHRLRAALSA